MLERSRIATRSDFRAIYALLGHRGATGPTILGVELPDRV